MTPTQFWAAGDLTGEFYPTTGGVYRAAICRGRDILALEYAPNEDEAERGVIGELLERTGLDPVKRRD